MDALQKTELGSVHGTGLTFLDSTRFSRENGPCNRVDDCHACLASCPCAYGKDQVLCNAIGKARSCTVGSHLSSPDDSNRPPTPLICVDNYENADAGLGHDTPKGPQERSLMRLWAKGCTIRGLAVALFFAGFWGFIRTLSSGLPPDFSHRWRGFLEEQHASLSGALEEKRKCGSRIYDVHGELIATIGVVDNPKRPSSHGANTQPFDIPASMWQAVVASEDRRFFEHHGVDPRGIARALLSLSSNGGGSTITQQLVKNVFLTSERKWVRKTLEIFLALALELRMSKWDILYMYLKKIYWGHGVYGIEAASSFYFGKHPSMLTLGECAMLAGIIPAPELMSPFRDLSRGKKGQARALRRMVEAGFLDTCSAESTLHEPLHLGIGGQDGKPGSCKAQFFVDEVLFELKQKFGYRRVFEGGLQVHTTLDLQMQEVAEKAIQAGVIGYENERVALAEMEINKIQEQIEGLDKAREIDFKKAMSEVSRNDALDQDMGTWSIEKMAACVDKKYESRKNSLQCSLHNHMQELNMALKAR